MWACAYKLNGYNSGLFLKCEPRYGVIKKDGRILKFFPYKKNGEPKKKGIDIRARFYTDTYEECV